MDPDHVADPGAKVLGVSLMVRRDAVHVGVVCVEPGLDPAQLVLKVDQVLDAFVRQEVDHLAHSLPVIDGGYHLLAVAVENGGLVGDGHRWGRWREGVQRVFGRWRVCDQTTLGWRDGAGARGLGLWLLSSSGSSSFFGGGCLLGRDWLAGSG